MKALASFCVLILLGSCSTARPVVPRDPILHAWLQWVSDNTLQARAIVSGTDCPSLITNLGASPMKKRAAPTEAFPSLVCEGTVPAAATTVQVTLPNQSLTLPIPAQKMARIVLIGDTGCRLKAPGAGHPGTYQNCNDPKSWPLATVAEAAAKWKPDMVIHLGDIHYREAPCPASIPGCAGAASGYNWLAWEADFFTPADPLLKAAPWLFVRGNHELCSRAGAGWFQILDPREPQACTDQTENYTLKFGSHELTVVDGSDDKNMGPAFQKLNPSKSFRWLLVHRPFLTANEDTKQPSEALLPEALKAPGQISMVLAGHIHALSLNRFKDQRPAELIIGNTATGLLKNIDFLKKREGDEFYIRNDFGFVTLEQKSISAWLLQVHDPAGKTLQACEIKEKHHAKTEFHCSDAI